MIGRNANDRDTVRLNICSPSETNISAKLAFQQFRQCHEPVPVPFKKTAIKESTTAPHASAAKPVNSREQGKITDLNQRG
jgi:hypothetical protein